MRGLWSSLIRRFDGLVSCFHPWPYERSHVCWRVVSYRFCLRICGCCFWWVHVIWKLLFSCWWWYCNFLWLASRHLIFELSLVPLAASFYLRMTYKYLNLKLLFRYYYNMSSYNYSPRRLCFSYGLRLILTQTFVSSMFVWKLCWIAFHGLVFAPLICLKCFSFWNTSQHLECC